MLYQHTENITNKCILYRYKPIPSRV